AEPALRGHRGADAGEFERTGPGAVRGRWSPPERTGLRHLDGGRRAGHCRHRRMSGGGRPTMPRWLGSAALLAALLVHPTTEALGQVTRIELEVVVSPALEGRGFGSVGQY